MIRLALYLVNKITGSQQYLTEKNIVLNVKCVLKEPYRKNDQRWNDKLSKNHSEVIMKYVFWVMANITIGENN